MVGYLSISAPSVSVGVLDNDKKARLWPRTLCPGPYTSSLLILMFLIRFKTLVPEISFYTGLKNYVVISASSC